MQKLVGVLDTLWRWVDDIPPAAHTLRYGNPAYRAWFAKMADAAPQVGCSAGRGPGLGAWAADVSTGWSAAACLLHRRRTCARPQVLPLLLARRPAFPACFTMSAPCGAFHS